MAGKKRKQRAKELKKLKRAHEVDDRGRPVTKKRRREVEPEEPEAETLLGVAASGALYLVDEARNVAFGSQRVEGRLARVGRWDAAARTIILDAGGRVAMPAVAREPSAAREPSESAARAPSDTMRAKHRSLSSTCIQIWRSSAGCLWWVGSWSACNSTCVSARSLPTPPPAPPGLAPLATLAPPLASVLLGAGTLSSRISINRSCPGM